MASFGMECDSGVEDLSFDRFVLHGSISSYCQDSIVSRLSSASLFWPGDSSKDPMIALPTSANAKLSEDVPEVRHSEV